MGCGNDAELSSLKKENATLKSTINEQKTTIEKLKNDVAMYVPKENKNTSADKSSVANQPVELVSLNIVKSITTDVDVSFKNISTKNIDAIEFVILQFDNFGRPAYRFNDPSAGNVTSKLTMQDNTAPGGIMKSGWSLYNTDRTMKGKVVVKQVHFTDGAVWTNNNFDSIVNSEKDKL
ncbi:DUF5780 domain-containing protein [Pectinatus brassicae]|uniref:DUF5780 domain-containing protein n=1 Tax=Pectinatus brassicae TaxID=862415 RepID=A0A840UNZ3_9FIRM|nr:DUF5780 domain-containing protein [Pectinatus brassicae]MBB5337647.1 hypothetical protein [Pectinatus brassicae]